MILSDDMEPLVEEVLKIQSCPCDTCPYVSDCADDDMVCREWRRWVNLHRPVDTHRGDGMMPSAQFYAEDKQREYNKLHGIITPRSRKRRAREDQAAALERLEAIGGKMYYGSELAAIAAKKMTKEELIRKYK